ncbi:hypothetical protein SAE02_24480 [Skermanella aerolata]|uniref:SH3b domain-containing protein n=1 Tax=Skermanella aerolata TaxID=393310 RepID=A0A512DQ68_9PROT|nr:SH3 domain-containing protein [Skermanella aerolata]KJB95886.1 hypothetical protein N826_39955 [Skermanella aerolata KACC 11604]GEO38300.1 hypothetical protein SAE02_24480 [Skermanella aerolata]
MRRSRIRIAALAALALTAPAAFPAAAASRTAVEREAASARPPLEAGPPALRANGRVNLRAEPSRSAAVLATVEPGTILESPGVVTGLPWVAVSRDGRLFGYVFAELVSSVASGSQAAEIPAAGMSATRTIDDRLRAVEETLSGMRVDLDQQAQLSREGFERTGRQLSDIQARLPEADGPAVVRLQPPPTRLDVAIASVRELFARIVGN